MAEKKKKRKIFAIPEVTDLDQIVEVESVFSRNKKAQKIAIQSTKPPVKSSDSAASEKAEPEAENEISSSKNSDKLTSAKSGNVDKNKDVVKVGRNFLETFAFIEDTKFYQDPVASATCTTSTSGSTTTSTTSCTTPGEGSAKTKENIQQTIPVKSSKPNAIIVSQRQKGNPMLKFFQNVPWEYGDIIPDYVMGPRMCALFLSIRYHNFNPNYIHERLKKLGNRYELRILLVQIDIKDPHKTLKELTKIALLADLTLILAWSAEEAARYIEMYKVYENKPPDVLQGQASTDYMSQLSDCLTTVKSVNKTDAVTLISTFQSLKDIISASTDDMALCPGFGPLKAKRLHDAFHQPFIVSNKKTPTGSSTAQIDATHDTDVQIT